MRAPAAALGPRRTRVGALWLAAVAAALVGCRHAPPPAPESTLPETPIEVPDLDPRPMLEAAAGVLDPTTRAAALGWLLRLDPAPAGGTWGARALYDPSARVQRAAVEALATRIAEPETRGLLEEYVALGQADPYVRCEAGLRLAAVGSPAAATALSAAWRAESEPWIVAPLALAAAENGDTEALDAAAKALATGEIGLEVDFLRAVGASGHSELQAALRDGASGVEDELALPFAVAQVQLGDPSGEQALRKALQHPDPEVRMGALDLLLDLDHPTAIALLEKARDDDTELIRWYARLGLAARQGGDVEAFSGALESDDREVRALGVRLLGAALAHPVGGSSKRLRRDGPPLLALALRDSDGTVRLAAVRVAVALDLRDTAGAIAPLTRDPWELLRVEAAGAALQFGIGGT